MNRQFWCLFVFEQSESTVLIGETLGANQGRRVNKRSSKIKNFKLLLIVIIWSSALINVVLNDDPTQKGTPSGSGSACVSDFVMQIVLANQWKNQKVNNLNINQTRRKFGFKFRNLSQLILHVKHEVIRVLWLRNFQAKAKVKNEKHTTTVSRWTRDSDIFKYSWILTSHISRVRQFCISTAYLISITIYILLIRGNIESNPGMLSKVNTISRSILTFNCNGLGDSRKLKRLLTKLATIVEKGGIVFLQETHIVKLERIRSAWKHKFLSNCKRTNSAGVMILFGNEYEVVEQHNDEEGRFIAAVIKNEDSTNIISNVYFPNDHKDGIDFAENVYEQILELQHRHPDIETICAGDFNVCLREEDSMNRVGSHNEKLLATTIIENNKITNLTDAYRMMHKKEGFTWKRGICYSRLDYVFVSENIKRNINEASAIWSFESSDHAAVKIDLEEKDVPKKGPGIIKVNTKILEDPRTTLEIEKEIEEMMKQVGEHWDPHTTLEFMKVAIRSVIADKNGNLRKVMRNEVMEKEEELQEMEKMKINAIKETEENNEERLRRLDPINKAITALNESLNKLRNKLSETKAFLNKVKWFEYGEKSNKFFLNLAKSRQKQKLISVIKNGNITYKGQAEVTKGVRSFYEDLYEAKSTNNMNTDDDFYKNCPSLNEERRNFMDENLSLDELAASTSCSHSAVQG